LLKVADPGILVLAGGEAREAKDEEEWPEEASEKPLPRLLRLVRQVDHMAVLALPEILVPDRIQLPAVASTADKRRPFALIPTQLSISCMYCQYSYWFNLLLTPVRFHRRTGTAPHPFEVGFFLIKFPLGRIDSNLN
jgi:hypothetical protein